MKAAVIRAHGGPEQLVLDERFPDPVPGEGEVAEVGPGVTGWAPGDRVLVDPIDRARGGLMGETIHGGLAERCRASAAQLIRIPDRITFEEAAALPVAYGTAYRMMLTRGHVEAGEKVLI